MKIGIIGGSNLKDHSLFQDYNRMPFSNDYGKGELLQKGDVSVLLRHGTRGNIPPHQINYCANLKALQETGVEKIFAFSSVGSLKPYLKPGTLLVANDYIHLWNIPTFHDRDCYHVVPELDCKIAEYLILICEKLGYQCYPEGVYIQTCGPRYETRAEINILKDYAHVVGMTSASEATLAREAGIPYGLLCAIDNYAHGLTGKVLDVDKLTRTAEDNRIKIIRIIEAIIADN
ncbi:MTAP family purine nucleoside phosphorylase [bacterium]|nr:MTAP family purine nucleoside phosphorylase [bacterium]